MSDFNEAPAKSNNNTVLIVLGIGCGCGIVVLLGIAILAFILLPMMLPAVSGAREAARRMQCMNNMKQIGLALHTYHDAHGSFPPVYTTDENGKPLHNWRVLMLPYMEHQSLYENIRLDEPWDSDYNKQFHDRAPSTFRCPSATGDMTGMTSYSVVVGAESYPVDTEDSLSFRDITDGLSNTVFLVERKAPVCWMDPTQEITFEKACEGINVSAFDGLGSNHPGGMNIGLFDGSVLFISNTIDPGVLRAILTWNGGESMDIPE